MSKKHLAFVLILATLLVAYLLLPAELRNQLTLRGLQAQLEPLRQWQSANPWSAIAAFAGIYVVSAALALPWATLLTLMGGALFGFAVGLPLVLFSATIGATLAMLLSRTLLREWVRSRWRTRMEAIEVGIAREGSFYLFALRVVPLFPFFAINLMMGLTPVATRTFFWVSLVGMLPGTAAYVYAGRQFGQLSSVGGLLSPGVLGVFAVLGLLPLLSKRLLEWGRRRKH